VVVKKGKPQEGGESPTFSQDNNNRERKTDLSTELNNTGRKTDLSTELTDNTVCTQTADVKKNVVKLIRSFRYTVLW